MSADASTPHFWAAAETSIMRAWAPATRSFSQPSRTEVEPPVIWPPSMPLMYTSPGGAKSTLTLLRSTSSSSATRVGRAMTTPCPISERAQRMVILLSLPTRIQALIADSLAA
ncbi:MAG TPA: hypothetical protein VIF38_00720 [Burkholderiales bacterium]